MKRSLSLLVFGCLSVNVAFGFSTSDLSKHLGKIRYNCQSTNDQSD
jgi:hypothetical protein